MIVNPSGKYCTKELAEELVMMKIVDTANSGSRDFIVGLLPKIAMMIAASSERSFQNVLPLDRARDWASEPK